MEMPSRCIGHATKETQHVTILCATVDSVIFGAVSVDLKSYMHEKFGHRHQTEDACNMQNSFYLK
jgi:uncharacterized protein YsxB (DUF464 family)